MGRKEDIFEFCKKENRNLTAREILNTLYPGKQQAYVNSPIMELVLEGRLIREDTKPYTVHVSENREAMKTAAVDLQSSQGKEKVVVPRPCPSEAEKYLKAWDNLENYTLQEKALNKLFHETYPSNKNIEDVLVKVATLNDFYSTQIFSVYPVAKHIIKLDIDERLKAGDITLVNDIAAVTMESGAEKNFYSFATKYCSHHQPMKFAIYDSYVEKVLKHFRKTDGFSNFADKDLKDYAVFNRVLVDFQKFYGLEQYNLKDLDRYLWQLGKDKFPKKF